VKKVDRESAVDNLLRRDTRAHASAPGDQCLEAGTVAAWFDGALSSRERAAAEAHAAGCARCQAVLAAMAHVSPPLEHTPWWRVHVMVWLTPVAAAAAAVMLWAVVAPGPKRTASEPAALADARQTAAQTPPPQTARRPPADSAPTSSTRAAPAPAPRAKTEMREQTAPRPVTAEARRDESSVDRLAKKDAAEEPRRAQGDLAGAASTQPPVAAPAPVPAAAAAPPAAPAGAAPPPAPTPPAAPPVANAERAAMRALSAAAVARPLEPTIVTTPGAATRWRLGPRGAVERSVDNGATWQSQDTGVSTTLTAGASPSPLVCWLVGPQGTVLLSTDGRSWRRLAPPASIDLLSVRATDGAQAVVTAADGRAFATADAGVTWTAR